MLPLHTKPTPMPSGVSIGLTAGKGEASANSGCPRCCFHPPWANPATPAVPEQEDTCGLLPKEGPAARTAGGHTRSAPGSAGPRVRHGDSAPLPCASETLQTRAGPSGCHFPRPALDHKPLHQENRKRAGLLLPRGHAQPTAVAEVSPTPAGAASVPAWRSPPAHRGAGSADEPARAIGCRQISWEKCPSLRGSGWKHLVKDSLKTAQRASPAR